MNKKDEIQNKMIDKVFQTWKDYLKYEKSDIPDKVIIKEIKDNFKLGLNGVENELDKLRDEFDKINKDHPYYEDLDILWDLLNHYKDYLTGTMTKSFIDEEIKYYSI